MSFSFLQDINKEPEEKADPLDAETGVGGAGPAASKTGLGVEGATSRSSLCSESRDSVASRHCVRQLLNPDWNHVDTTTQATFLCQCKMEYFVRFSNVTFFLYILVYVCQFGAFVWKLLYNNAWSLCDWPCQRAGREARLIELPTSSPWWEVWEAPASLDGNVYPRSGPSRGPGRPLALCYLLFQ